MKTRNASRHSLRALAPAIAQNRLYQRVKPSGLMARNGKIIVGDRIPALDCRVVDYSPGGACLQLDPAIIDSLPERFALLYSGTRKKCRQVWTKGHLMGVSF